MLQFYGEIPRIDVRAVASVIPCASSQDISRLSQKSQEYQTLIVYVERIIVLFTHQINIHALRKHWHKQAHKEGHKHCHTHHSIMDTILVHSFSYCCSVLILENLS